MARCRSGRAPQAGVNAAGYSWRGGRAVDCAGLENRKAERPREFESHPLRHLHLEVPTHAGPKSIKYRHNLRAFQRPSARRLMRATSRVCKIDNVEILRREYFAV